MEQLLDTLRGFRAREAFVFRDDAFGYDEILHAMQRWSERLAADGVAPGDTIAVDGDYSPSTCALVLALVANANVIVPLTSVASARKERLLEMAEARAAYVWGVRGEARFASFARRAAHPVLSVARAGLRGRDAAGLLVAGDGDERGALRLVDVPRLLAREPEESARVLAFTPFDRLGGVDRMLRVLARGGLLVTVPQRDPAVVFATVERHRVQLLPATPLFLEQTLESGVLARYDAESLERVVIDGALAPLVRRRLAALLPGVHLDEDPARSRSTARGPGHSPPFGQLIVADVTRRRLA